MKSIVSPTLVKSHRSCAVAVILLATLLALSAAPASADYLAWVGNADGVWNDEGTAGTLGSENWNDLNYGPNGRSPLNYDLAIFDQSSPNMTVTFSAEANPFMVFFNGNGAGYTIGSASSAYGLDFNNFTGITMQATLAGTGGSDTVDAPINAANILLLANFSPATAQPSLASEGAAGSNNTLNIGGPISLTGNSGNTFYDDLQVFGMGNIAISGNITAEPGTNSGAILSDMFGGGTLTLSGSNSITNGSSFGGNAVLDYTTNNTDKVSETGNLDIGYQYTNYSGNVGANGGNVTILGNQSSATTVNVGSARFNGSSTLTVAGGTATAPTTVSLGNVYGGTYGSSLDISTSGTANVFTTATNGNGILDGQGVTFSKNYWATVGNGGLISALTSDGGSGFSDSSVNYTVGAGVGGVQTLSGNGGANTIRFASTADGTDLVNSAATLDLGGNTLYFGYGGVLVGSDVTTNTAITDGTLANGTGNLNFINYGSGTLTIGANLTEGTYAFDGGGTFEVTGNNLVGNPGIISINSGKVILGSAEGLGSGAKLDFGSANTTLDLAGHNLTVGQIISDADYAPGNTAAAAGLNSNITNSVAGSLSTLTVESNKNVYGSEDSTDLYGYNDLGYYQGGLNEAAGAIIAIDIEQGTPSSGGVQAFLLGTANPIGDQTGANVNNALGLEGTNTVITGDITVGASAGLGYTGYGFVETMGALDLNGIFGINGEQANGVGVTYLTGTGAVVPGPSAGNGTLYVNVTGTNDTFAGTFGTASNYANTALVVGGGSTLTLSNGVYVPGVAVTDGSTLVTAGSFSGNGGLNINGDSTVTFNGSGGQELGGDQIILYDGTINIAASSSGQNVVVTGVDNRYYDQMQLGGGSAINLDAGNNTSLTVELGQTSGNNGSFITYTQPGATLSIGSAQGLSALGTTDKFITLASNLSSDYLTQEPYGIVHPWVTGVNMTPGSSQNATFLSYQGTGQTTDGGFTPYVYNTNAMNGLVTVNNLGGSTGSNAEDVTSNQALTGNTGIYALEVDNGAKIDTTNGTLYLGYGGSVYEGGLILNGGASITGAGGVRFNTYTNVYTDLDNGTIENLYTQGQWLSKTGAGTLFLTGTGEYVGGSWLIIDDGALDVGNVSASGLSNAEIVLQGGVLQGNGGLNENLVDAWNHGVSFNINQEGGSNLGGGFSAAGGDLFVTLNGNAQLVWDTGTGGTPNFLSQNAPLLFGSTTATGVVDFSNPIDLGLNEAGNQGGTALYDRVIQVTANASDSGDPLAYADLAQMDGVISSTNPYVGLAKTENGVLRLTGANTYTGATSIEGGTLEISDDSNLGAAPTAAYALNVGPDVAGAALTPGAVQINSGATLAFYSTPFGNPDITLNSNRQLLLASGNGSVASNIDVQSGVTASFGGIIADYVGETGSLNVEGGGAFDYSGTSANTGGYSVTGGTFIVSGAGSINSGSGVNINSNALPTFAPAVFNYQSSVGLSKAVTYGAGGGTFAYNTSAAYTGGALHVGANDILTGSGNLGTTAVSIGSGGTITPGQIDPATGILTQGATTLLTGGNYNFLIADATGAAGVGYSTVNATSLDISSLTAGSFTINLESLSGNVTGDAANFDPTQDYSFVLINAANGITGTFNAADFTVDAFANNGANGFTNTTDPYASWSVSEQGDNLVLSYTVPEPSTYAMLLGGLALLAVGVHRKLA